MSRTLSAGSRLKVGFWLAIRVMQRYDVFLWRRAGASQGRSTDQHPGWEPTETGGEKPISGKIDGRGVVTDTQWVSAIELLTCCTSGNLRVEKFLANIAICRRSLMTNPAEWSVGVFTSWRLLGVIISFLKTLQWPRTRLWLDECWFVFGGR